MDDAKTLDSDSTQFLPTMAIIPYQDWASIIAHREGKKHEALMGDIKEILSVIAQMEAERTIQWMSNGVMTPCFIDSLEKEIDRRVLEGAKV